MNEDLDAWIATLEECRMKLEGMGSVMEDEPFMIHMLNNLTRNYELQMFFWRKNGSKENLVEVEKLSEHLNLLCKILSMKSESSNENK
jgi:hypothetical protein